ncbi:hypothetical protein AO498_13810 [Algoriphagus sanaruensis]|uniref:Glycosyl transferase family 1 domain-containing protein n=2 Tax=Algoriphagus sanaruensis TaxID=1727163 RepID=A0A142EQW5_9BACT|nr:hypothetical protein AO498_13810 [Algoriphagus sanaruensis]
MVGQYIKSSKVINQSFDGNYVNLSTSSTVDDIGKSGIRKWVKYLKIVAKVFHQGLFNRPDLAYITLTSNGPGLIKDAGIVFIFQLLGLPHVFHFHNKGVKKYSQTLFGKFLYPFVFKKAQIILLSPLLFSDIENYVSETRVHYCTNGILDMRFAVKDEYSSKGPIEILFLSNLIRSKGVLDLLGACSLLKNSTVNFRLTIAGGEGDISSVELEKLILKYDLEDYIIYKGKVQGEDKKSVFHKADIFVHPTHEDCFPLVLLEAMQAGLPIISTYEGAIPEIVEDGVTGLLVPFKSPAKLANAILVLCENPVLREAFGKAGKEKFQREYTLEKFENRFVRILSSIN